MQLLFSSFLIQLIRDRNFQTNYLCILKNNSLLKLIFKITVKYPTHQTEKIKDQTSIMKILMQVDKDFQVNAANEAIGNIANKTMKKWLQVLTKTSFWMVVSLIALRDDNLIDCRLENCFMRS